MSKFTPKHRSEVIEVYPSEGKAAVRFSYNGRERVECVRMYIGPDAVALSVGMKGWVNYTLTPTMGVWGFDPYRSKS